MPYESDYYTSSYLVLEGRPKPMIPSANTSEIFIIEAPPISDLSAAIVAVIQKPILFPDLFEWAPPPLPIGDLALTLPSEDPRSTGATPGARKAKKGTSKPVDLTGGPKGVPTTTTKAAGTTPMPTTSY
jgi:hypothetical protein